MEQPVIVIDEQQKNESDYSALPAASISRRFFAVVLNNLFCYLTLGGVFLGLSRSDNLISYSQLGILVSLLFFFIFQFYFMYKYRQTIGKRILKIKVIRYPDQEISFGRYVMRECMDWILGLILSILYMLPNLIVALMNKKDFHRGITDGIVGTRVVKLK